MTALPKSTIKSYFETNDRPTQSQFADLIDSYADFGSSLSALTGDVTITTPVSGSAVATISSAAVTGAKIANNTITTSNIYVSAKSGTASVLATVSGAVTAGHSAVFDAQGNIVDGGGGVTYRGCAAYISVAAGNQSIPDGVFTALLFDSETYDTDNIHSIVTNISRFTVPSGVTKIRMLAQISMQDTTTNTARELRIYKNGSDISALNGPIPRSNHTTQTVGLTNFSTYSLTSAALICVAGDYFEVFVEQTSGGNLGAAAGFTWGEMQVLQ